MAQEGDEMELRKVLEAARATLARVQKVREALGRALTEQNDAARKANAAEASLAQANTDRLVEGGDVDLEALRKAAERARSASSLADRSVAEVRRRLGQSPNELAHAKGELERALALRSAQERAKIAIAAREAVAPFAARIEALEKIVPQPWSPFLPVGAAIAHAIDQLNGTASEATPAERPADLAMFAACKTVITDLSRLEQQLREELSS
jgi:hypothetical protein